MKKLKIFLNRLTQPAIIISVISEIIALLVLFNVNIDEEWIMKIVTGISSILVLVGIVKK